MFGRVLSALFSFAGWFAKSTMVKFGLFFGLFFVTSQFIELMVPLLPGASSLQSAFSTLSPGLWYFLTIFQVPAGVPMVLSAYVTRFMIRRIPVIG
jgi:hypothetical protein